MTVNAEFRFRVKRSDPILDRNGSLAENPKKLFVALAFRELVGLLHVRHAVLDIVDADEAAGRNRAVAAAHGHFFNDEDISTCFLGGNGGRTACTAEADHEDVACAVPVMFVGIRNFKRFGSTAQSGCAGGSAGLQKRSSVESRHIVNLLCSKANLAKTDFFGHALLLRLR